MFEQVLSNPFDDIIPREKEKAVEKESSNKKEKKRKGTKYVKLIQQVLSLLLIRHRTEYNNSLLRLCRNFSLLSFGEEAEDDEEQVQTISKVRDEKL